VAATRLHGTSARAVQARLRSLADPRVRAAMVRFGVHVKNAHGISMPVLHKLAREIGTNHDLAKKLWASGNHEARILAALIGDPARVTWAQMERWARGFDSWDIVDGTCWYLFGLSRLAWRKAVEWPRRREEFVKRAGFTLMAYLARHDKRAADAKIVRFLPIIRLHAADERNFVKKAINWALREIGKRNLRLNRRAIRTAHEIRRMDSPAARWIASDALRELTDPQVAQRLRARQRRS